MTKRVCGVFCSRRASVSSEYTEIPLTGGTQRIQQLTVQVIELIHSGSLCDSSYAGGARVLREEIERVSVLIGADATIVISTKQGVPSKVTGNRPAADW